MKFTNRYNLPEGIYNAIVNHDYDKGRADYSVSELLMPPQMRRLFQIYGNDVVIDVSENIWSLFGTSVHYILDRFSNVVSVEKILSFREQQLADIKGCLEVPQADNMTFDDIGTILSRIPPVDAMADRIIKEERFYITVGGIVIGGKPDWFDKSTGKVEDYKVTSTWKVMHGDVDDWETQQNIYRYLLQDEGYSVKELQINAILKDWKGYQRKQEGYPPVPFQAIPLEIWSPLDTITYIVDRLKIHKGAESLDTADELAKYYPCTVKDKWAKEEFAVMKKGGKKASAKFDTAKEAQDYMELRDPNDYVIEDRTENKRCDEYCNVSKFCHQHASYHSKVIVDKPNVIILPSTEPTLEEVKSRDTTKLSVEEQTAHFNLLAKLSREKVAKSSETEKVAEKIKSLDSLPTYPSPPTTLSDKTVNDILAKVTSEIPDKIPDSNSKEKKIIDTNIDDILEGLGL